jgi:hypothetical protein
MNDELERIYKEAAVTWWGTVLVFPERIENNHEKFESW